MESFEVACEINKREGLGRKRISGEGGEVMLRKLGQILESKLQFMSSKRGDSSKNPLF